MKFRITFLALFISCNWGFSQALPNPGFEDWTATVNYEDPDGWTTANSYAALIGTVLTSKESAPENVHSGSFALKTETVYIGPPVNQPVPGLVTTGNLQVTTQTIDGGTPYTMRPDSIAGWYKYEPAGDDSAYVTFFLFSFFRDTIARAIFACGGTHGAYQRFSTPLAYELPDNPTTAFFIITPAPKNGPEEGSTLWLDDMEILFSTGIENNPYQKEITLYPTLAADHILIGNQTNEEIVLFILDEQGRKLMQVPIKDERKKIRLDFTNGLYMAVFEHDGEVVKTQKFALSK